MSSITSDRDAETLISINSEKLLQKGEAFQVMTLKDGSRVPTGTVATMLYNVRQYDALCSSADAQSGAKIQAEKVKLEKELALSISVLKKVGLFELFSPREWAQGESRGRRFLGETAMKIEEEEKAKLLV